MPLPSYANPLFSLHFPQKQTLHPALRHLPPAHLPLPFRTSHVRPATGPPASPCLSPASLPSRALAALCPAPSCRRLPFRTACARKSPSLFPVRCSGFARRLCGMRPPMRSLLFAVAVVRQLLILLRIFPFSPKTGPASCPAHLRPFPRTLSRVPLPPCAVARQPLFPLCSSRFPPAHASSPRFQPAPGPPLFRHSLSRSPGPGIRLPP